MTRLILALAVVLGGCSDEPEPNAIRYSEASGDWVLESAAGTVIEQPNVDGSVQRWDASAQSVNKSCTVEDLSAMAQEHGYYIFLLPAPVSNSM